MARFHTIEALNLLGSRLEMTVTELLEGVSDGVVGLPLVIRPNSQRYRVRFDAVGKFQVSPEPTSAISENAEKTAPFLYLEHDSKFKTENSWGATTFNFGRRFDQESNLKHYVVHAENYVVDVLTLDQPVVDVVE